MDATGTGDDKVDADVSIIWSYMVMSHDLTSFETKPASVVCCFGSSDLRVATHAAELFKRGLADWLLFSGGIGTGMHSGSNMMGWTEPEAVVFAAEAARCGVDPSKILIESESRNSGENIQFSKALLKKNGIEPQSLIVVHKPFMERRAFASLMRQWPSKADEGAMPEVRMSSPPSQWPQYLNGSGLEKKDVVSILVGDVQRMTAYAEPPNDFQVGCCEVDAFHTTLWCVQLE